MFGSNVSLFRGIRKWSSNEWFIQQYANRQTISAAHFFKTRGGRWSGRTSFPGSSSTRSPWRERKRPWLGLLTCLLNFIRWQTNRWRDGLHCVFVSLSPRRPSRRGPWERGWVRPWGTVRGTGGHFVCACVNMDCWSATEAFSVNCLRSLPAFAGCFLELNDLYWGYVPQTSSLRFRGISTMNASLL